MFDDNVNETLHTGPLVKAVQNNGVINLSVDPNLTSFEQQLVLTSLPAIIEKIDDKNVTAIVLDRGGNTAVVVDNEPTSPAKGLMDPVISKLLSNMD